MSHEIFNQPTSTDTVKPHELSFCDILETGNKIANTLKDDLTKNGPGMLKAVSETPLETKVFAAASVGLVTMVVLAESPTLIGIGGAAAIMCAGKVLTDTILPKVSFEGDNSKR